MMVIVGIGIDLVKIARMKQIAGRWQARFFDRVFTKKEQSYCLKAGQSHVHFSGRFAIKEAVLKALGTGLRQGFCWTEIETTRDTLGKPMVLLSGRVAHAANKLGVSEIFASISHDEDYAIAQVILQGSVS